MTVSRELSTFGISARAILLGSNPLTPQVADDDGSNPQLSQNSVNFGFNFMKAIFGTDALDAGETYDIKLQAFDDHGKIIAQVHDTVLLV